MISAKRVVIQILQNYPLVAYKIANYKDEKE